MLIASVHKLEGEIGFGLQNLVPRLKPRLQAARLRVKKIPGPQITLLIRRRLRHGNGGTETRGWHLVGGKQPIPQPNLVTHNSARCAALASTAAVLLRCSRTNCFRFERSARYSRASLASLRRSADLKIALRTTRHTTRGRK